MGTLYCDTGGSATNSGSTDSNSATLTGIACANSAGVLTLDALTDLSSVVTTPGPTQSSIYVTGATNSNRKIFWISAVSGSGGATPQVTVDVSVTGTLSSWAIGGRFVLTNAAQEGALRAGDTLIFNNSPASQAASCWNFRNAGDTTSGYATIRGKTGTRPVLTTSGSGNSCVTGQAAANLFWIENLELQQTHVSSGSGVSTASTGGVIYNVKVSDAGSNGITTNGAGIKIIVCELTGAAGDGININTSTLVFGCYIHDNAGDGIEYATTSGSAYIINNIIDTNGGRGIFFSGAFSAANSGFELIIGNTVYANGNSGLEVTDQDTPMVVMNNIFVNNGDTSGEYNVEWVTGTAEMASFHGWNDFFSAGGGGSGNLLNLTVNAQVAASEITTDPAMVNPASADFAIPSSSGAFATGFPGQLLGTNLGRANMGALQNNSTGGGGTVVILNTSP